MIIDNFLELLHKNKTRWAVDPNGRLRTCAKGDCPLTWVARRSGLTDHENWSFLAAGRELGLKRSTTMNIVYASDGRGGELRKKLMEACGMGSK